MISVKGYAAMSAAGPLEPFSFERREPGPRDVVIDVLYCGICHSDIHQVHNDWGGSLYPMVPGHEIVGRVAAVGRRVRRFRIGDAAGVGCMVDTCRVCVNCRRGKEQYCTDRVTWTYNSLERDGKTRTQGGYSTKIVVQEDFTLKVPAGIPLEKAAPLLCAGVTTFSPLRHFGVRRGQRVGVIGLGGLGHMAVKLAASMGAKVTVFSTSESKKTDARRLGASAFVRTTHRDAFAGLAGEFHFLLDTVSAPHDVNDYLPLLRTDGTMVIVGVPEKPLEVKAFSLIGGRRRLAGSLIGGLKETQDTLDYCARRRISADVEVIPLSEVNRAYERMLKGDVRYRFVLDLESLR